MLNSQAKWIWISNEPHPEEYVRFNQSFIINNSKENIILKISAETDYIARINGEIISFSQFPGFPFVKYYDEIDITDFCTDNENEISVTVRYEGATQTATHIEDGAGLIFTIEANEKLIAFSNAETLCGFDNCYIQHQVRSISPQLGFSSGMSTEETIVNKKSVEVEKTYNIIKRPVEKAQYQAFETGQLIKSGIYDLGRETAGYLYIKVKVKKAADFKICYGEHLEDGKVRRIIENRDFSVDFKVDKGEYEFTQYFLRIACRYLQVEAPDDVEVIEIGIQHYLYPLTLKHFNIQAEDRQIYETCVRTLRLCMNHHYEDCPWREQALYILDSRNQMLCGYYAFEETNFQRENILLISKGIRDDGFFELTFPAINTPSIPFFSIMYPVMVQEYIEYTGDKSILNDVMEIIITIMKNTEKRIRKNNLIPDFEAPYWNFYEWADGADGFDEKYSQLPEESKFHLILNCAFVYAGKSYKKLCRHMNIECDIDFDAIKNAINNNFYNAKTGLFANTLQEDKYSQLGNAFALLIGLGDARTIKAIKEDKTLIQSTLSMLGYIYDALLNVDFTANKDYVLNDIRKKYNHMLDNGATSFWETIKGQADFNGAGSLCHGWSAMPVYYFNKLAE